MTDVFAIFIDPGTKIKGMQIGDHEIKIVNFANDTSIFFRDFGCLAKRELILDLSQKACSSKINFSKSQELINQEKWPGHNSPSKRCYLFLLILKKTERKCRS